MTDLRKRIADVLCNRLADLDVSGGRFPDGCRWLADNLTETLLALDGVAIVELPEFNDEYGCFLGGGYPCNGDPEHLIGAPGGMVHAGLPKYMPPRVARSIAAALLAASNAAEETA